MESIPSFCINVPSAKHRMNRMHRRFSDVNLNVKQWVAATPSTLGDLPYADYLTPGQRGCAKSHYDIWCHIVNNSIPVTLIFEDDAVFRHDCIEKLQERLASIDNEDPEWDMLLLNASDKVEPAETWVRTKDQCMLAAYVLSLRGAQELVNLGKITVYASDWTTQLLQRRGHSYTYFPWLVVQDGLDSLINNKQITVTHTASEDWKKVNRLLHEADYDINNYLF
jgi:GR25 family glycosyltransferase involved in LPS biosynthesis